MFYCKKCVMPNTRPGISFDSEGICSACRNAEKKKKTDYDKRKKELETLCDKYRGMNGSMGYDCAIAVSGGKDSHYQVYYMKEVMGMNPILFSVEDNLPMTEAGKHNIKNISEAFGCPIISLKPDIKTQKILMKHTFEQYGKPTWFIDRLIYTFPLKMAIRMNTPFIIYGENVSYEYGGIDSVETYSARDILLNGVASDIPITELLIEGITEKELALTVAPTKEEISNIDPIYLSYFIEWNSVLNYNFAKSRGFRDLTHEWDRTMCIENFDQVDSAAYMVHPWLKYPKFGHACATDQASRFIRYGVISREEALELVKQHDHNLDSRSIKEFCEFLGYKEEQFYAIVDKLYNKEIFEKDSMGRWQLRNPLK